MMFARRLAAALLCALMGVGAITVGALPAAATQGTVPGNAASIWQTNGVVRAMAAVNGVLYVGGDFTSVRPPGAPPGSGEVARNHLAAFNASTGALVTSFNPAPAGGVRSLAVSPDGSRLYVGGDFASIAGQSRSRVAAFNTATRALTSWAPVANGRVAGISATADTVYLGGSFSRINSVTRNRVAAVDAGTGALRTAFAPVLDNIIYDLALSTNGSKLYLAGAFLSVNGDTAQQVAAVVDSTDGSVLPLPAAAQAIPRRTPSCIVEVKDIAVDQDSVYFAAEGTGGGCFDGTFAAMQSDGSTKWISRCLGATQGIAVLQGMLYTGSHAHDCSADMAFDPDAFPEVGWARGLSRKLLSRSAADGKVGTWYPNTNGGPPGGLGPRTMATDGSQIFVGGEFTTVNGVPQQGLTRFSPTESASAVPDRPATPQAVAHPDGTVSVFVQAPLDLDDVDLEMRVYRDGSSTPLAEQDVHSLFWHQPVATFVDSGLAVGSTHTYSVEVGEQNGPGVSPRATSAAVTVPATESDYAAAVRGSDPTLFWRLNEPSGPVAADYSASGEPGTISGSVAYRRAGATPDGDVGLTTDGATGYVTSDSRVASPAAFTVEAWVNTTTTRGGRIIGFGDRAGGYDFNGNVANSSQYDKHLYMTNDGTVTFGVYVGGFFALSSKPGLNDGQWHHLVGTQGPAGMTLYVDGVRQGRNSQSRNQGYDGYWRVGGDSLNGWPNQPTSSYFAGTIDDVAVYPKALTGSDVLAHYAASGRTADVPPLPTDPYGSAVVQDAPRAFWRFDESGGTTAADSSGSGEDAVVTPPVTFGQEGALGSSSRAAVFGGSPGNVATTSSDTPSSYAAELWFNTTTTTGGKLIGFGNAATGASGTYDKHVYMLNDGRLRFGVYLGRFESLTTQGAYNDGQWHHLVASQGAEGMRLYVDDVLAGSNATQDNQAYTGYWRVGGDNLAFWPDRPTTDYFTGTIDEVAIYGAPLSAERVDAHFRASGRTGPDTIAPAVSITSPSDGSTLSAGPVSVAIDASDSVGVVGVQLLVDGVEVANTASSPYEVVWQAEVGQHQLQARATDDAGNAGLSPVVEVSVLGPDEVAPQVAITSPTDGQEGYGPVQVAVQASDDRGLESVALHVDGAEVATLQAEPWVFDWDAVAVGTHSLTAVATDLAGNVTTSAAVSYVVPEDTTPPSAVTGVSFGEVGSDSVTLSWEAATDDRSLAGYVVLRDGVRVSGDAPLDATQFTDTGLAASTAYRYQVQAVDDAGNAGPAGDGSDVTTAAAETVVFAESWTAADGAPWASPWTTSSANGSATTVGGAGRLAFDDVSGAYARSILSVTPESDSEVLLKYQWSSTAARSYFTVFLRGAGGWQNAYRPRNGYGLEFSSTSTAVSLQRNVDGALTQLSSVAGGQAVTTAAQLLRLRVDGDTIQFKTWIAGQPEPASWNATVTDSTVAGPGQLFLSLVRPGSNTGAKAVVLDDLELRRLN